MRSLYRLHGRLARLQGDHLALLVRKRWYGRYGFASFKDFARETLQMSHRTTTRRVALSRLLQECSELAAAVDSGRLSPCQALALSRLRDAPDLSAWIAFAQDCTVRELGQLVADYIADLAVDTAPDLRGRAVDTSADPEEAGRRVAFAAPVSAALAWEHGMEIARRVLGWEAPPYRCVEAVLAEAAPDFLGDGDDPAGVDSRAELLPEPPHLDEAGNPVASTLRGGLEMTPGVDPIPGADLLPGVDPTPGTDPFPGVNPIPGVETRVPTRRRTTLKLTSAHHSALRHSIRDAEREMEAMDSIAAPCPDDPDRSIAVLSDLKGKDRRLRLLLVRLLRNVDAAGLIRFYGYGSVTEFLVSQLKMSRRTAARFMSEAWTFEDNPELARAFSSGRIGLSQAYLVSRVAVTGTQAAFIRRAESVTHLQFEREVRFLEHLAEYVPSVARQFHGPLPWQGLEDALKERLRDLSWTEADIEERVGSYEAVDPAVDPVLMRRLEALLEIVALALEEHDVAVAVVPTLATPTLGQPGTMPTLATPDRESAANRLPLRTTISFWAPESLIADWQSALAQVQAVHGPFPAWAGALFLLRHAVQEWERVDPARRPDTWKILERDEWRCQAPGCSSRRRLEVHHIIFRSHGGPDDPENLVTLCHGHHRRGIHDGYLRAEGAAPHSLRWHLGGGNPRPGQTPRPTRGFHGSRADIRNTPPAADAG
jgi:HNH endonuclease